MNDTLLSNLRTPYDLQMSLSVTLKAARRFRRHSRREAGMRTGIPAATIRRFEETGEISLRQFLVLWGTYFELGELDQFVKQQHVRSIDDRAQARPRGQ